MFCSLSFKVFCVFKIEIFHTSFFSPVRQPAVCMSWEEVNAICACLLLQAEEAEKRGYSVCLAERMIMEEFGRCLSHN